MKKIYILASLVIAALVVSGCILTPTTRQGTDIINPDVKKSDSIAKPEATNTALDLSNQNLTQVKMSVFDKLFLEELDVSYNNLTGALPSQIGKLQNLRVLTANNNQMTGVPAEIGQLKNLEVLNLANNNLTGLPYELGNLKQLKTLNLSGNQYSVQDLEIIRQNLPNTNFILE